MTTALLLRVSTARQAKSELPIERQEIECRAYCQSRGWTVSEVFADPGVSGGKDELSRDGLAALLAAADQGRFEAVVMWSWSRLARDEDLSGHLRWLLRRAGVACHSVSEPEEHPLLRAVGAWRDAQFRRDQSEYSRSAHRHAAAQGRKMASDPFGFTWQDRSTLVPHATEAPLYASLYDWYLAGVPTGEIARRSGLSRGRVHALLRSRLPIGDYVYGARSAARVLTVHEAHHEAIVSRDIWAATQAALAARGTGPSPRPSPVAVSGLLVCACGARLDLRGTYQTAGGPVRRWYRCRDRCGVLRRITDGTASLVRAVAEELRRPDLAEMLAAVALEAWTHGHSTGAAEAEVRRLERVERSLTAAIESGEVADPRTLARSLGEAQRGLKVARAQLTRLSAGAPVGIDAEAIRARLSRIAAAPVLPEHEAGRFLRELVEEVRIPREGAPLVAMRTGAIIPMPEWSHSSPRVGRGWEILWREVA